MTEGKRNLSASVMARLLNRANQTGNDAQTLLRSFCFERFLSVTRLFLLPVLADLHKGAATPGTWTPGGPWHPEQGAP